MDSRFLLAVLFTVGTLAPAMSLCRVGQECLESALESDACCAKEADHEDSCCKIVGGERSLELASVHAVVSYEVPAVLELPAVDVPTLLFRAVVRRRESHPPYLPKPPPRRQYGRAPPVSSV